MSHELPNALNSAVILGELAKHHRQHQSLTAAVAHTAALNNKSIRVVNELVSKACAQYTQGFLSAESASVSA